MRAAVRIAERYASVDPLPLVPATWIELYDERWGFPKWERSRAIRPSERSIAMRDRAVFILRADGYDRLGGSIVWHLRYVG